jgi:hypothetical protein
MMENSGKSEVPKTNNNHTANAKSSLTLGIGPNGKQNCHLLFQSNEPKADLVARQSAPL